MRKTQYYPLNCTCDTTGRIVYNTKEDINKKISSLLTNRYTTISIEVPAGEGDQGFEDSRVPDPKKVRFGEVADAVNAIYHDDNNAYSKDKEGVEDKFVKVANSEKINDEEFEGDVKDLDVGIDVHFLVGYDGGIIGDLGDAEHGAQDAHLIDPMGGRHASGGDDKLVGHEPQTYRLGKDKHNQGNDNVDYQCAGKGFCQALLVSSA